MISSDQILKFIEERIGHIYFRPLRHAGTALEVDAILYLYHELWSVINDKHIEFLGFAVETISEEGCSTMSFSTKYNQEHPEASEIESAFYVVDQWIKISEVLAIPIPYEKIKEMYKNDLSENEKGMLNTKLMA